MRDVATLLTSFRYAAHSVLFDQVPGVTRRPEAMPALEFWAGYWADWVSAVFLKGYFERAQDSRLFPADDAQLRPLLDAFLLERSLEESAAELSNHSEWVRIPIRTMLRLLDSPPA